MSNSACSRVNNAPEIGDGEKPHVVEVNQMIDNAAKAAKEFRNFTQEQVDEIVYKTTIALFPHMMEITEMVQEDSGFGCIEDKYFKLRATVELVHNYLRDKKTVGVIKRGDDGIIEVAQPIGIVAGILNCTGAGAIDYFKAINALKTRNAIILAPHPRTASSSYYLASLMHRVAVEAGAPENCIQCIESPSIESTQYLLQHRNVSLVWATGGAGLVRAAYSSGNPALGVGPGNTPVYVDESVDTDMTVECILLSRLFDGGTACTSESNLFVHRDSIDGFKESLDKYGCYIVPKADKGKILDFMFPVSPKDNKRHLNADVVGIDIWKLIQNADLNIPATAKALIVEMANDEVGSEYPMSGEKLSCVMTLYTVDSADQAMTMAVDTLEFVGKGHTAVIHSNKESVKMEYAERIPASRIVANAPATQAACFDTYNKRIPTYSVGCGKMGNNISTQSIHYIDLLDVKRYSERMEEDRWYVIPKDIHKEDAAKDYLRSLNNRKIAAVVEPGITDIIETFLRKYIPSDSELLICTDVEPDPSFDIVNVGAKKIREFGPDMIMAVGGGSAIDSAKGMWIMYEHPDLNLREVAQPFFDIHEQVGLLPKMGVKAEFVAVPTTCGTGSEVTPAAVLTDTDTQRKYVVFNYELTPNVALLISDFIWGLPKHIMADTAIDALTHAVEAYVSIKDCEAADINSINAVRAIVENLPAAFHEDDKEARSKLLYAATDAGKAISNAFLGINHSLAHQIGAQYHVPHGAANALFLIPVIKYNSAPVKDAFRFMPYPNQKKTTAGERYAELAKALGLKGDGTQALVNAFCEEISNLFKSVGTKEHLTTLPGQDISKDEFDNQVPLMAKNAFQDICIGANPRFPSLAHLERLLKEVY